MASKEAVVYKTGTPAISKKFWNTVAFFFIFVSLFLLTASAQAAVSQVHLSWQNDPATTMTAMWSTSSTQSPPTVEYGLTTTYGNTATGVDSSHGIVLHTVELTGLQPDTLYHYRVSDDGGGWSQDMTFRTAPAPGSSGTDGLVFTVVGDKGTSQNAVNINDRLSLQNADLHLIAGDLAYSGTNDTTYHTWFDQQTVYASSSPLMPAWGNHDTTNNDPPYSYGQAHFVLPTNATSTERYYSYNVGNAHFVAVDSNSDNSTSPGSEQYTFIQNDLIAAAANSNIKWIIVYFHHNIYSGGGSHADDTQIRANLQPLFDQYNVDLVLHGHNHNYARTKPLAYDSVIKDDQNNSSAPESYNFAGSNHGQIYLTVGGGGQSLYACSGTPANWLIRCDATDSFAKVTINGNTLNMQAIKPDGTVLDDGFTISKTPNVLVTQFSPTDDATVHQVYPTTNYGSDATVEVDADDGGGAKEAYLKFNVSGINGAVTKAELKLTTAGIQWADSDSTGLPYTVSDTSWTEGTITWNTKPARSGTAIPNNTAGAIGLNQTKVFDVTSAVTGNGTFSFAISSTSTNGIDYNSEEATSGLKPELVITWEPQTSVTSFSPTDDATVHQVYPTTNYGSDATVEVDADDGGGAKEAYLKFNVSGINGAVTKAELKLTTAGIQWADSDSTGLPYTVSDTTWSEGTITWNNRPVRNSSAVPNNTATSIGLNQTKVFDITSVVTGNGTYSFAIASASTNGVDYNSDEATSGEKPQLVVYWQDTVAPSVSITNPLDGATVSGVVTVTADASDNVGVVGVQFKLDGSNLASEDTLAPYSVNWDTTTVSNGTHTLTAVARDGAGNSSTSTPVNVTVSNTLLFTFSPTDDAQVRGASPNKNYGQSVQLGVDKNDGGYPKESYLKFNVTGLSGTITKAELKMTTNGCSGCGSNNSGLPYTVSDTSWTENTITWNNRPPRSATPIAGNTGTPIGLNQTKVFVVTSVINGNGLYSFAVASPSTDGVVYKSGESTGPRPILEITTTP